ncbi:hypothetical protein GUJ93_ZPchr0008g12462 [Zizania palustris]|uniref:PIPK domain-containing protein n=1 Tax=Zizania palustris TaxID=103762 RepID=A0A8J5QZF5_ZIZPA|nr:hypothetical protein GUJ93_ZPchr0008g12462 [Zizania palustris]
METSEDELVNKVVQRKIVETKDLLKMGRNRYEIDLVDHPVDDVEDLDKVFSRFNGEKRQPITKASIDMEPVERGPLICWAIQVMICCCPRLAMKMMFCCKRWSAQGGKSNVYFAKTLDERFIIKQFTRTELESFVEFAPQYFKHLMESLTLGSPTCLAKIVGLYQTADVMDYSLVVGIDEKKELVIGIIDY